MGALYDLLKTNGEKYTVFRSALTTLTANKNYPLNATIQLTPLCNLKCKMCYARLEKSDIEKMFEMNVIENYYSTFLKKNIKNLLTYVLDGDNLLRYETKQSIRSHLPRTNVLQKGSLF